MQWLGFPESWIERVMSCVTMTSFSILVNGRPFGNVLPSRGILSHHIYFYYALKGLLCYWTEQRVEGVCMGYLFVEVTKDL